MSLLSVWLAEDGSRALVGVDTEAASADGAAPRAHVTKLAMVFPAGVIAIRGIVGFLPAVFCGCVTRALDFDGLMEEMPRILGGGVESLVEWQRRGLLSDDAPIDKLEAVLVGWSESKRRIIARVFEQTDRATGFVVADIPRSYLAPCDCDDGVIAKLPDPSSREAMTAAARAQVRRLEEIAPESSGGGTLILATVTRRGVNTEAVCELVRLRKKPADSPLKAASGAQVVGVAVMVG